MYVQSFRDCFAMALVDIALETEQAGDTVANYIEELCKRLWLGIEMAVVGDEERIVVVIGTDLIAQGFGRTKFLDQDIFDTMPL